MRLSITNPKKNNETWIVWQTIETGPNFCSYGEHFVLQPGQRVFVNVGDNSGVKIEKLPNNILR